MAEQNPAEAEWLSQQVRDCKSILEIGSRGGAMLTNMAQRMCVPGAKVFSIDIGDGDDRDSSPYLLRSIAALREQGFDAEVLISDSKSEVAMAWAKERAPFDFIFIDGDHTSDGAMADWCNYGHMGKVVGFHDIIDKDVNGVWLKAKHNRMAIELKAPQSHQGIGLIYMWPTHT